MVPAWQIVFTTFGCGYIVGVTHMIAAVFFVVKVPTARALNSFRRSKCKRSHIDVRRSAQSAHSTNMQIHRSKTVSRLVSALLGEEPRCERSRKSSCGEFLNARTIIAAGSRRSGKRPGTQTPAATRKPLSRTRPVPTVLTRRRTARRRILTTAGGLWGACIEISFRALASTILFCAHCQWSLAWQ